LSHYRIRALTGPSPHEFARRNGENHLELAADRKSEVA
jgi:hypothetical protein